MRLTVLSTFICSKLLEDSAAFYVLHGTLYISSPKNSIALENKIAIYIAY